MWIFNKWNIKSIFHLLNIAKQLLAHWFMIEGIKTYDKSVSTGLKNIWGNLCNFFEWQSCCFALFALGPYQAIGRLLEELGKMKVCMAYFLRAMCSKIYFSEVIWEGRHMFMRRKIGGASGTADGDAL